MRYGFSAARLYLGVSILPWLALLGGMAALAWFLTDDAFISFRYARNLLEGHGLVFNPGERVEGYSNFLWTLELAALWGAFGLKPEYTAQWLSVAYTAGTLAVLLWWGMRTPGLAYRGLTTWLALGLVCSSATFAIRTSGGGLETRQFTFFIVLAVVCLALYRRNQWGLLAASLSLAAAALTRPEGPLIAALCGIWFVGQSMADTGRLRPDWRGLAYLIAPCVILIGAHFLFRYGYYGEWLPNTYYAKFVRPWYEMGFRYLWAAALETGLYLLLPLAWIGLRWRWREHRDGIYALVLLLIVVYSAYVMRVGGDSIEYRPLDFYWPLLALPAATGIVYLGSRIAGVMRTIARRRVVWNTYIWALLIFAPVLFYANAMQAILLLESVKRPLRQAELTAANYGWLLAAPGMPALSAISNDLRADLDTHFAAHRFDRTGKDAIHKLALYQPYASMERDIIPDDAVTLGRSMGIIPYYIPDLQFIDYYGLTDATVARNPVNEPNHQRKAAHDREPPPGYPGERGVNIYIFPASKTSAAALEYAAYAVQVGPDLWMPFDAIDRQWVLKHFGSYNLVFLNNKQSVDAALGGGRQPAIYNAYDVYHTVNTLVYVKDNCRLPDLAANFFLHITPVDLDDLPNERRQQGYDNWDFNISLYYDHGIKVGPYAAPGSGECVVPVKLPSYSIAAIRTGQFNAEGRLWEGEILVLAGGRPPAVRSIFDVYHTANSLIYVKDDCRLSDIATKFFLHITPADPDDLPSDRRQHGYDNRDFDLYTYAIPGSGECVIPVALPSYPIATIQTGQYNDGGRLWEGEIIPEPQ